MRAALLSDVHISTLDGVAQRRFVAFVDQLEADELYILGDLFHAWWDFSGVTDAELVPTLEALGRLRARGVQVHFIPGNHDFAVGETLTEGLGLKVHSQWRGTLAGHAVVLMHGDEADDTRGYRVLRRALRGKGFALLMRALGPGRGLALLKRMAGSSRAHGDARPKPWLQEAQRGLADRELERGADVVVMGHSHCVEWSTRPNGLFVNLGDFGREGRWLAVDEELELRTFAVP